MYRQKSLLNSLLRKQVNTPILFVLKTSLLRYNLFFLVILGLILLIFAQTSWAAPNEPSLFSPNSHLTPPSSDLSVSLLASMFGYVDNILFGVGSQTVGAMFKIYNSVILTLGLSILVYTLVVGTLNTAADGEFLGKKWSSLWLPIRTIGGVTLLLPKASGYCLIQILVMWIVVQGIGAADLVWGTVLDKINKGGSVVQYHETTAQTLTPVRTGTHSPTLSVTFNAANIILPIGNLLKSQICMYALQNSLMTKYPKKIIPHLDSTLSMKITGNREEQIISMQFPGKFDMGDGNNYEGVCGGVAWRPTDDNHSNTILKNHHANYPTDSRSLAIRQLVSGLQEQARNVADILVHNPWKPTIVGQIVNDVLFPEALYYQSLTYRALMVPYLQYILRDKVNSRTQFTQEALKSGWILAGAYFYNIASIVRAASFTDNEFFSTQLPKFECQNRGCIWENLKPSVDPMINFLKDSSIEKCQSDQAHEYSLINQYICKEYDRAGDATALGQLNPATPERKNFRLFQHEPPWITAKILSFFNFLDFKKSVNNIFLGLGTIEYAQTIGGHPILLVAKLGITIIDEIESLFFAATGSIFLAVLAGSLVIGVMGNSISTGIGQALIAILNLLTPFLFVIFGGIMALGATMAYYVPLVPFILFFFGTLSWFASVIEAMIAAPIVALGLAHPEGGHEHLGQAGQAVMLLTNVFLRPVLMIFGFVFATILCSISIWLLNFGFIRAWSGEYIMNDMTGLVYIVATLSIYTTLVLTVLNYSFSLIYEIPNKVLRWVGGSVESSGEGHALEQVKQGHMQALDKTTSQATSIAETGAKQAGKFADKLMGGVGKAYQNIDNKIEGK